MKNYDLINIIDSLSYLAGKETSAWFEIGKNLRLLNSFKDEVNSLRADIKKNCAFKDEFGNYKFENGLIVWKSKKAEKEQDEIWQEFINQEAETIDFIKIPLSKLDNLELNGGLLSNLIEIIIE